MNVTVQSGKPSLGSIISPASMIIKAVAAYMAITLMTFLRFSSCQNWMSLLGLPGMLWCDWSYAIYNLTEYESNNEALLKAD